MWLHISLVLKGKRHCVTVVPIVMSCTCAGNTLTVCACIALHCQAFSMMWHHIKYLYRSLQPSWVGTMQSGIVCGKLSTSDYIFKLFWYSYKWTFPLWQNVLTNLSLKIPNPDTTLYKNKFMHQTFSKGQNVAASIHTGRMKITVGMPPVKVK